MTQAEEIYEPCGLAEGTVLGDGEVIVYDRDKDGNVIGWHKELAGEK